MTGAGPGPDPRATPAPGQGPPALASSERISAFGHLRAAGAFLALAVLLTGVAYPVAVTAVAQALTPETANGSLLHDAKGTVVGSSLIAQNLSRPYLFWERPSSSDYNSLNASPTLYGYSDPALVAQTRAYVAEYGRYTVNATVPLLLVTSSASGLDPELTPEAVLIQVPRILNASQLNGSSLTAFANQLLTLVDNAIVPPAFGFIGTASVNVLSLDLALLPLEKAYGFGGP